MLLLQCPICDAKQILLFQRKAGCDFSICQACGIIFQNPQPAIKKLVDDFLAQKSGYHSKLQKNLATIKKPKKFFVNTVDTLISFGAKGNLLDVGCANGEFMKVAKEKGFNVFGVEVNKDTAKIATDNGLNVFMGTLQAAHYPNDYFSAISLLGVMEAVTDPVPILRECYRILKKDGLIVISTPNTNCFFAKATLKLHQWLGIPWSVMIPYYRLFIFSNSNLKHLLVRLKFNIRQIQYPSFPLKHELASTGLLAKFGKEKSIGSTFFMVFVFLMYSFLYAINVLISPFLGKNFKMVLFATK